MRATAQLLTDIVSIGAHVKALAAHHSKIHIRHRCLLDLVVIHADKAWLALHFFALTCKFIQRHTTDLDGADHRWRLVEIAFETIEGVFDFGISQGRHFALHQNFTFTILCARRRTQSEGSRVFLVLAHQQILQLRARADDQDQHAGSHGIQRAAVPDFFRIQATARDRHHIVGGHVRGFIYKENAVKRVC
ncbi:MAG: hypothetical protein V4630_14780 [Pseudomonadota bacterium]